MEEESAGWAGSIDGTVGRAPSQKPGHPGAASGQGRALPGASPAGRGSGAPGSVSFSEPFLSTPCF